MVYKVMKCIYDGESYKILDFLEKTSNFRKRFYKVSYEAGEGDYLIIKIHAVGISRDLIYEVFWEMNAKCIYDKLYGEHLTAQEELETHEKEKHRTFPRHGWVPEIDEDKHRWFSTLNEDRPKDEWCYLNILDYEGFIEVDYMEEK